MAKISVSISGVTPLICNRFTDAAAMQASSGRATAMRAGDRGTPQEICEGKLYIGLSGKPMIPMPNLMRSIVDGGTFHKAGKSKITTQKGSLLYSCMEIEGTELPIIHKAPWRVDTRAVVIPSTRGRVLMHRPLFEDWALNFTILFDADFIGEKLMRAIVDDAGSRIGLGDFRPACKGPYGKYRVDKWAQAKQ